MPYNGSPDRVSQQVVCVSKMGSSMGHPPTILIPEKDDNSEQFSHILSNASSIESVPANDIENELWFTETSE